MKDAEEQLDLHSFVRVHRSTIVAVSRIASLRTGDTGHVIELLNGVRLKSSRQYAEQVRNLLV